jgi:putative ABC transport system ATP-binding protein
LISGLDFPTSGKVYINDKLIDYKPTNIALIFQNHYLFNDLTAFDNVCLSAYITNQEINLESINLLFKQFQLTHIINQKVKFCSGGEKQRISILRAIVSNPEIIIADEPTGALDEKTANIIVDNFKKLSYKRIIIVITHNKKLFKKVADKIFNLKNGQLYEENTKTMEESHCI